LTSARLSDASLARWVNLIAAWAMGRESSDATRAVDKEGALSGCVAGMLGLRV